MKTLSLKFYPPKVLIAIIICIIIIYILIENFLTHVNFTSVTHLPKFNEGHLFTVAIKIFSLAGSTSVVYGALSLINRHIMWAWYLKLLEISDLRGSYEGNFTSSYHLNDNPALPHVTGEMHLTIYQNLNGIFIEGKARGAYNEQQTSEFKSVWAELRALDNKKFELAYEYDNKGNIFNREHERVNLNNHEGFARLIFNPANKDIEGYYYTYERGSRGTFKLLFKES